MSRPGAIHRKIVELLTQHPEGLCSGQIRSKLNIPADEQAQLDRRRRELRKWYVLEKRQEGNECIYTLKGELQVPILERGVNIRVRAAVLGRAHGRCQMCGRTITQHDIVLRVDHKIPVDWGGSNEEENLWAICERCCVEMHRVQTSRQPLAYAFLEKSAKGRIKALLAAKAGQWVPGTWLKAAAAMEDWSRVVRSLRTDGHTVLVRKVHGTGGSVTTYYSLSEGKR